VNQTPSADVPDNVQVPHENSYTFELFQLLVSSLPRPFKIDLGVNGPAKTRTDIVVSNRKEQRVVLEMAAHVRDGPVTRQGTVAEHIVRFAKSYSQIVGVKELWVSSIPPAFSH
jgi:hypothetical protein